MTKKVNAEEEEETSRLTYKSILYKLMVDGGRTLDETYLTIERILNEANEYVKVCVK